MKPQSIKLQSESGGKQSHVVSDFCSMQNIITEIRYNEINQIHNFRNSFGINGLIAIDTMIIEQKAMDARVLVCWCVGV